MSWACRLGLAAALWAARADAQTPPAPIDWRVPHGSIIYRAERADVAPAIDGVLDDAVWGRAPVDARFASARSKPYGLPTPEPTAVQVAYDQTYLYVAFRCGYSGARPRDDSLPADERTLFSESERVGVLVDARLDHATARSFTVGRTGARGDLELTQNGALINREWRGIWDAATRHDDVAWTAEFRIPWGTLGLPTHEAAFEVGINFNRVEPRAGEYAFWALVPPASSGPPSFYGHLVGLSQVRPSQRLFLQPFLAVAVRQDAAAPLPALRDFSKQGGHLGLYGGFYARYRPAGPLQVDLTMNPDFSTATPDEAVANLDRFELSYPEVRPFFSEDRPRFEFGVANGPQLFYSRRLGLRKLPSGSHQEVPIVYGAKAIVRGGGIEIAAMSVGMAASDADLAASDHAAVLRLNHSLGEGRRIGAILLGRDTAAGSYGAAGGDGQYTLFDQHLTVSGFYARSATTGAPQGGIGAANAGWASQDFNAGANFLTVEQSFDPQLGFVPARGIVSTTFYGAYTPLVTNDLVRQVLLESSLTRTTDRSDQRIYDRGNIGISAEALDRSMVSVRLLPSVENVASEFKIAADRIVIPPGRYRSLVGQLSIDTPPRRTTEGHLGYSEGDLFGGYQRAVNGRIKLNLGRFAGSFFYEWTSLRHGERRLVGHRLSARSTFTYTPLARTTLIVEANTLILRSLAQLVTSITFGSLSTVSLTLSEGTGQERSNLGDAARWYDHANFNAVLAFNYGFTPF